MINNKRKILNDPVYGFINIPDDLVFDIIEHPYFQRLRRIQQLGLTHYVYPGALHTRFHHALGSMHLMNNALEILNSKGTAISDDEYLGALIAILLHDIGHAPFSHSLEQSIISGIKHEDISRLIIFHLNRYFGGKLEYAYHIFNGEHPRKFLHQLVSGQLDVDRLDYLTRDSFFTGVSEGIIGTERIIKMLNVVNNELVIEEKGIYSLEKFLMSRQLMFLQVYQHKAVVSARVLMIKLLQRALNLCLSGAKLSCSPALKTFLSNKITKDEFLSDNYFLTQFCQLDDYDIISAIKAWMTESDFVLSQLSKRLINRNLLRTIIKDKQCSSDIVEIIRKETAKSMKISEDEADYFIYTGEITAQDYSDGSDSIKIFYRSGNIAEIRDTVSIINFELILNPRPLYYLSFPKEIDKIVMKLL